MAYIAEADIQNVFGVDNVTAWSDLQGTAVKDTTRIAASIAYADEQIDNRFRDGLYEIPFSPVCVTVKHWAAVIAGLWLFESRPLHNRDPDKDEGFEHLRDEVELDMQAVVSGQKRLTCNLAGELHKRGPVVVI